MRIKISLIAEPGTAIPIEYNYNIYLSLKKLLLDFLLEHKPRLAQKYKQSLPDFTFSQLMIPDRKIELGFIEIIGSYLSFFLSALDADFMEYIIKGLNQAGVFTVHEKTFQLKKVEIVEEPIYEEEMKFRMLSPLLLVKLDQKKPVFIRPEDSELNTFFAWHLADKYNKRYKSAFSSADIHFQLDQNYLERKRSISRLLTIRNVNYKTIFAPFSLRCPLELLRFAYNNGIGEKTQFGLGMIESADL